MGTDCAEIKRCSRLREIASRRAWTLSDMLAQHQHTVDLSAEALFVDIDGTRYRMCRKDEGPRIGAFLERCHDPNVEPHGVELDWSKPPQGWLLAESGGEIVGCVALATALPVGFAENMMVDPGYDGMTRGRIISRLTDIAHAALKDAGACALVYLVPDQHTSWKDALVRRGAKVATRGEVLVRGL